MYTKMIISAFFALSITFSVLAQPGNKEMDADAYSLQLYNENRWRELLKYGNQAIDEGTDFPLLRMRMGYAAFLLGNYSESLRQYLHVYKEDTENEIALYYVYLSHLYLNNITAARFYAAKLPRETRDAEKLNSLKISQANIEYSYKMPDILERGDASYTKIGINTQLGYRLELQQAVALYNQVISESKMVLVDDELNIRITQKEYYGKLLFSLSGNVTLIGGGHYLHTTFNNYLFNNYIGFMGLKYTSPYIHLQGLGQAGNIRDSSYYQADATVTFYPMGNLKLYSISKASMARQFVFTQVLGTELLKNTWVEANVTLGRYETILGNDAIYVFDDIDTKKLKTGASIYMLLAKKMLLSVNYNFEKKQRYDSKNINYKQYSITGGLQWNF